jgi:DNA-binding transcriptional ArsR family regulator
MVRPLDPILHSELRLAIVSFLMNEKSADFSKIKEHTGSSSGNISIQLKKLEDCGYIETKKSFKGAYPQTSCKMSKKGIKAFDEYSQIIKEYLKVRK